MRQITYFASNFRAKLEPFQSGDGMMLLNVGSRLSVGVLASIFVSNAAFASTATNLRYSDKVSLTQQQLLNADIENLYKLIPEDSDGELKRVLKLNSVSARGLDQWLSERIQYVVEESFDAERSLFVEKRLGNYSAIPATKAAASRRLVERSQARVVMSNLGATIYIKSKQKNIQLGTNISGVGSVSILSPRVGLLQVGEELFRPLVKNWSLDKINNQMHSIWRLTTLFHEARHSDGNGQNLSFTHTMCPAGHSFAGKYACDSTANGAYRISSLVMSSLSNSCVTCTKQEKDVLSMLAVDHLNRILVPVSKPNSMNDLCRLAETQGTLPRFCKREDMNSENEVDDSPEYMQ